MKILCLILLIFTISCAERIKKAKYSAYEMAGLEKRDLFKREVSKVNEDQKNTGEALQDALARLQEIYKFDGGNLEREHDKLKSSLNNAQEEAAELSSRIRKMDKVAGDLFDEWKDELNEIKTSDLRVKSSKKLADTKRRYRNLELQMRRSEKNMAPVLTKLNDQVLFLKHNLNAEAIGGLKTESVKIQADIKELIDEVDESTRQAEALIKTL
jgi:predicted  nucleic acid-binding Zn-ribbon protein